MGEAGGRAARDRVGGPLTFFFSSSLCSAFFWSVGLKAIAKYITYFAFSIARGWVTHKKGLLTKGSDTQRISPRGTPPLQKSFGCSMKRNSPKRHRL